MFCKKCGKELRDGLQFCPQCGTPVKGHVKDCQNQAEIGDIHSHTVSIQSQSNDSEKEKTNKGMVIAMIVLAIFIIAIGGVAFWMLGGKDLVSDLLPQSREIESDDEDEDETKEERDVSEAENDIEGIFFEDQEENNTVAEIGEDSVKEEETVEDVLEEVPEDVLEVSEYLLEDSDNRYITKKELEGFDAQMCRLARNELYARHGRKFDDEELQSYFDSLSWYQGTIEAEEFEESMLNDYEVANRDLIVEYEEEMGYR